MSKELDYLDDILKNEPMTLNKRMIIECIKEKIQRLEAIENANPSEALEEVGYLKDYLLNMMPYYDWLNDVEKYILKAQEQEKENKKLKSNLSRWLELLETDGIDSKNMVANDIQAILKEVNK